MSSAGLAPKGSVTLAAGSLHQFAAINLASGLRLTAAGSGSWICAAWRRDGSRSD